jgi:hypothetical protein
VAKISCILNASTALGLSKYRYYILYITEIVIYFRTRITQISDRQSVTKLGQPGSLAKRYYREEYGPRERLGWVGGRVGRLSPQHSTGDWA